MRKLSKNEIKLLFKELKRNERAMEQNALVYVGKKTVWAIEANINLRSAQAEVALFEKLLEEYNMELYTEDSEEDFKNEHFNEEVY